MTRGSLIALGLLGCLVALWFAIVPRPGEVAHAKLPDGVLTLDAGTNGGVSAKLGVAFAPHAGRRSTTPVLPPTAAAPIRSVSVAPSRAPDTQVVTLRAEGPIAERKATFAKESRDTAAAGAETALESAFRQPDVPAALFQRVQCRQTICKLELRWSKDRSAGYMAGMMRTFASVTQQFAVEPLGIPDKSGQQVIDVYLERPAQPHPNGK